MTVDLRLGDCLELIQTLGANCIDALVTDPPAGIKFMGKEWDTNHGGRKQWIEAMTVIFAECLRVLKPGAHATVWALPRTSHWTATALEDAGFEIRDVINHLFGQGFPKSANVSKQLDKMAGAEREILGRNGNGRPNRVGKYSVALAQAQTEGGIITAPATPAAQEWDGWGTALKPACEHWILVRKPLSEKTVAANVLRWGTGAINVDGCRIEGVPHGYPNGTGGGWHTRNGGKERFAAGALDEWHGHAQGRFPANVILSCTCGGNGKHDESCAVAMLDKQSGERPATGFYRNGETQQDVPAFFGEKRKRRNELLMRYAGQNGGASRFFYVAKASRRERDAGLEGMPEAERRTLGRGLTGISGDRVGIGKHTDVPMGEGKVRNYHPTVKSVSLMRYLCRLVTPPRGVILDCFMGSGSTGVAATEEGFSFIGFEREAEYFEIAERRIRCASRQTVMELV